MNLNALCKTADLLDSKMPHFAIDPEREKYLYAMDSLLEEADSERSKELAAFYRKRVDRVIREVAAYKGDTPRLWKLYSSGIIIKDKKRTVAVDINRGCVPASARTALLMSVRQIGKLADLIDVYFCTHAHADHVGPELCDALCRRGKTIVMPQTTIDLWTINGATPAETFKSSYCKTYLNWQGTDERKGLDNAMYLFTLSNGKTVFIRGDIYHGSGFLYCLEHIEKWNKKVDYTLLTPYFTSGDSPVDLLNKKYACRFLQIHEWEFSHRPAGTRAKATQDFKELYQAFAEPYADGRVAFLFWGESIGLA